MPIASKNSISSQLNSAQMVIANTLRHPDIQERVAARGYTAGEMAEGQRLCDVALQAVDAQSVAASRQRRATEQALLAEQRARTSYQALAQTVRAVFPPQSAERKALEVAGPTPETSAAFISAATTLLNNALGVPEIAAVLAKYGYDEATLRAERDVVAAYQQAVQAQALAMSAARQATRAQNQALAALQRWVAQYLKIAKIALRSEPDLLKALGVTPPAGRGMAPRQPREDTVKRQAPLPTAQA